MVGASSEAADVSLPFSASSIKVHRLNSCRTGPNKTESASTVTTTAPQPQTKKQRQNAQRREALKEAKRERDVQQQAVFASHKRDLDRARWSATSSKRTGSRFDSLDMS